MNTRMLLRPLAALALLALAAPPAHAACTYTPLTSDVMAGTSASPTIYRFTQSSSYWTAVAVRPAYGEDWDITVFGATAPDPTCVATPLASSTGGASTLDFVVGDFNHDPTGTYYAYVTRFSGTQGASVQWDDGPDAIPVNGAPVSTTLGGIDLVRVWDVYLNAGTTYTFDFYAQTGFGGHLLLFRNSGGGTYWAGRGAAEFDVTGPTTYTAPTSGYYGVVVTSDLGYTFNVSLGVTASACPLPTALAVGASISVAPNNAHVAFDAENQFWMGLAVRPGSGDWDVGLYGLPGGAAAPVCYTDPLATSSQGGAVVDLTVGDFNHTPQGWYFGYPYLFSGVANAQVQFTGTSGQLQVNNDATAGSMAATDVAQAYDVYLTAGRTYAITFSASTGINLLVFANEAGGAYFGGRTAADASVSSSTTYTAPVSGWYGLFVVNDGGVAGPYSLGVGDCSLLTPLASDTPVGTGSRQNAYLAFTQTNAYWTAVAVRCTAADWDLYVNADDAVSPAPACTADPLANSVQFAPAMDFVVGDFNRNPLGTYYVHAHQYTSGVVQPARVEWDAGYDRLYPNDVNMASRATGPDDLIGCWDVFLNAGQTYAFTLQHSGGADLHLFLFRNAAGGTYWAGRNGAEWITTTTYTYTAPSSGFYGVIVSNDNAVSDAYQVAIRTCDPVVAMPSWPWVLVSGGLPEMFVSFTQSSPYWTAVSTRAANPAEDWDMEVDSSPTGGAIGTCFSGLLANSFYVAGLTDYVIGDFNHIPLGTYYARGYRYLGTSDGHMEFYPGNQQLVVNAPHVAVTVPSLFEIESWDCLLLAGQQYSVSFAHDAGLDAKVDIFAPTGAAFWGGRSTAMLESSHSVSFIAPTTGWYGVVVVSDGGSGWFDLGMGTGLAAVDDTPRPDRDALAGVSPNPGHPGMSVEFALHEGAEVRLEFLDMAGRVVSRLEPGSRAAGRWSVPWTATGADGRRLRPGIYIVRMHAGGRLVGTRKLALLD